ncbi:MAG: DUF5615 family PIN-like protein [Bacteroidota bacterium]
MKLIVDEDVHNDILVSLQQQGFDILSIREHFAGTSDFEVIRIAQETNSIVITEDKDFGEWIFAHGIQGIGVIFLRYEFKDVQLISSKLISFLQQKGLSFEKTFITITKNKIRSRKI